MIDRTHSRPLRYTRPVAPRNHNPIDYSQHLHRDYWGPGRLKELRSKLRLNQQGLADLTGLTRSRVTAYENGYNSIPTELWPKLAEIEQGDHHS